MDKYVMSMWWLGFNWNDRFCFWSAANQETGRCRRIQMSDEVMSLSRCSDSAVLSFGPFHLSLGYLHISLLYISILPVYFTFTVCPSVPETLNLWGQSRSQVRSSGTGLHSVSTSHTKEHFVNYLYMIDICSNVWCFFWWCHCLTIWLYNF